MSAPTLEQLEVTYYTGNEVAKILRRDPQTIRIYARTKQIGSVRVGRHYRYSQAHIDAYLAANSTPAPEPVKPEPSRNPNRRYKS